MNAVIETVNISKFFGPVRAVDTVNLRVEKGEIYGFLGMNGAGKTTTIRALLGMVRPTAGHACILGKIISNRSKGPWKQVGYLVESPTAYPELSVRENLEIARRLYLVKDTSSVSRVIEKLGLQTYADRKAGTLSQGNLQRLGLARALLHKPEVLILDEPSNGLDPAGVVEIRELLTNLASEQGVSILMSSHILTEVDRLADRIGIIHKGRLITELDTEAMQKAREKYLIVDAHDRQAAKALLIEAGYIIMNDGLDEEIILTDPRAVDHPEEIATLLVNGKVPPVCLQVHQENLESYFLRLTGSTL